jgi:hypothetical protein
MRLPLVAVGLALLNSIALVAVRPTYAQFEPLAAKVPSTANAITLLDAKRLLDSPLAAREGWKDKYEKAFASGLVAIPPNAVRMILAAELDYEFMKPRWELVIADLTEGRSVAQIARLTKGTLDQIGDVPAVSLRDDSYVVELGSKRLGAMAPANRQAVARWLREVQSRMAPELSAYLKGSLVASDQSQIVMAFDLDDAIPPDVIRAKLASSAAIASKKVDVEAATKALAGVRGLAVEVAVTDGAFGRLRVHFDGDASALVPVALPLLLEILGDLGARLDDVERWKVTAEPQRISFNGPLSTDGMKRVFSLIDSPTLAILASDPSQEARSSQPTAQAYASQQYFKSLSAVLDDVRTESKEAKTFGQNALWFDKWSRRIDRLPIVNVDSDLLNFGRAVAGALRNMAASMRGIGINSAAREANIYQTVTTDYNGYAGAYGGGYSYYTEWRNVDSERRAARADERSKGALSARDIAREIENETAKIRQAMTQKYSVPF